LIAGNPDGTSVQGGAQVDLLIPLLSSTCDIVASLASLQNLCPEYENGKQLVAQAENFVRTNLVTQLFSYITSAMQQDIGSVNKHLCPNWELLVSAQQPFEITNRFLVASTINAATNSAKLLDKLLIEVGIAMKDPAMSAPPPLPHVLTIVDCMSVKSHSAHAHHRFGVLFACGPVTCSGPCSPAGLE
jgi:hypothetical protein